VRPGITGLAQVLGSRGLRTAEGYALDVWYVRHRSLLLDAAILGLTLPYVVGARRVPRRFFREALEAAHGAAEQYVYGPARAR
jgi:lipopolysaccharide/colanic/teichoic acid biosynthesis glycosyltransferase